MRIALSLLRIRISSRIVLSLQLGLLLATTISTNLAAQPANNAPNALIAPAGQQNAALFGGQNSTGASGQQGGGANADFDSLIDLIQSTVATETWAENGGGEAEMRPFPGGVLVDAAGMLRLRSRATSTSDLAIKRGEAPSASPNQSREVRRASALRYVSLPRLEREIARRQAARQPMEPAMLTLAGLQRVRYIFIYPESGDLVLAGPAGDWQIDAEGRIVSRDTGRPVVRLDDLLLLLRRGEQAADSFFGCSINPRQESLAKTQAFLASTGQKPLQPGQRKTWLRDLRDSVGQQDIEIFGVDQTSRVASVLVEADYHMKLIGMGLADGVDGVDSYLDLVKNSQRAGVSSPPPMSVLRWWFTLNYETIGASAARDAFELIGQGVRVLSENEMLADQGKRVHTGRSEPLNRQFAESFTAHFNELAAKYPVYGELRNIFDLAMAVALIDSEKLAERANWEPGLLTDGKRLRLPEGPVPQQVETVINHRLINGRQIVAGVSGGVMVAPGDVLKQVRAEATGVLNRTRPAKTDSWWWDSPK